MMRRRTTSMVLGATLLALATSLAGCAAGGVIGVVVENYKKTSTHEIKAQYTKLEGHSFAVVVASGRGIESETPGISDAMMERISIRLAADEVAATGAVQPQDVVRTLYNHPSWQSMTYAELAKLLGGVDRLVYIELEDFRLTDPGNSYEWAGVASGRVMVIEADGLDPDRVVFEKLVSVQFPTKKGFTPDALSAKEVASTLLSYFVDRASWLFYDHQEPYYPEY